MANNLATFAESALPNGGGIPVEVKRTSTKSPWYISAFLCSEWVREVVAEGRGHAGFYFRASFRATT
ncbi:MAG: hypothetical protein AAF637_07580 [Pseudomonadota bacterium]